MKTYFAYIRVSTVKQGEKGSSLNEQRDAIEAYARRQSLAVSQWFDEKETAAKQGRPIFSKMLKELRRGAAAGVITHKIDRSARNLRDWAMLGELVDAGVELHFAHESLDLTSRGGRLAADIQAVVAADYIRNLRDEVRKGFYGRIKQGLYPLQAPLGYLDQGGGVPKVVDPIRGPLIARAFELYGTGEWSLRVLADELYSCGLRARGGGRISINVLSTILANPFYIGLMRLRKANEIYPGKHPPLVSKDVFDRVQAVKKGKFTHKTTGHKFRYQRMVRCQSCRNVLTVSRHKGHAYYRCRIMACPTTCLREERIDGSLRKEAQKFRLREEDWPLVMSDIETVVAEAKGDMAASLQGLSLAVSAVDARLARLTDAFVDQLIERSIYLDRKEALLRERAGLLSRTHDIERGKNGTRAEVDRMVELIKALGNIPDFPNDDRLREVLREATSNLTASGKNIVVDWANPFRSLISSEGVLLSAPDRSELRTRIVDIARKISKGELHLKGHHSKDAGKAE